MKDRSLVRKLAEKYNKIGDPLSLFEQLYKHGKKDLSVIPWADLKSNPNLVEWFTNIKSEIHVGSCLVIGCGLGDDPEFLSGIGFSVDAFDISATAIEMCKKRFPESKVNYFVDDITSFKKTKKFDFVFEAYTLQVLPPNLRLKAMQNFSNLLNNEGTLLIICRARNIDEDPGNFPYPLTKEEFNVFENDFVCLKFEDYLDINEEPPIRRFRILYKYYQEK